MVADELKIEYLPVSELKPYEKNAKLHPKEQVDEIVESIELTGFNDPIAVWGGQNIIVEGHGRLMAAKKMGMEKVPIIRLDHLSDEQRRAYTLIHNKLTMNSDFDLDVLQEELDKITEIDMSDFEFDLNLETDPDDIDEDEVPATPKEPKTKRGDIYQLGNHRLMCGDSTILTDVEKLMNGQKADLFLTDPPYNVNYEGATKDKLKIENDNMDDAKFRQFLVDAFSTAKMVMKAGAAFYIWHADSEGYNFRGACHDIGWQVRECLIWEKQSMVLGRQDYQWIHEPCLYGWQEGGSHAWYSDRKQTTIIKWDRPTKNDIHPTMKPVGLFGYLIGNSSKADDIVLDLFGGSGTSIIACEQMGRACYSMELSEAYCDVIVERWEKLTGRKAVLLNGETKEGDQ
jgi:site-specific DNA-methyltransferase (adenine-specific)